MVRDENYNSFMSFSIFLHQHVLDLNLYSNQNMLQNESNYMHLNIT